jgi:hypothetical protein
VEVVEVARDTMEENLRIRARRDRKDDYTTTTTRLCLESALLKFCIVHAVKSVYNHDMNDVSTFDAVSFLSSNGWSYIFNDPTRFQKNNVHKSHEQVE